MAVRLAPQDYAMQVRLAQCLQLLGRSRDALAHADQARNLHPREAQAHRLAATLHLSLRDAAKAWLALEQYDRLLPGDPGVIFLQGVALEGLGRTRHAAEHYRTYLRVTQEGQAAQYALTRLRSLGYAPELTR
jgi:Flp pilus assembly protein TadD